MTWTRTRGRSLRSRAHEDDERGRRKTKEHMASRARKKTKSTGGKNAVATLKEVLGDDVVGRTDVPTVPIDEIYWHPRGHKLRHPRADDPVDVALRDDIVEKGVLEPV